MEGVLVFLRFLSLLSASDGSHSLRLLSTYIKGKTQFPKFSGTVTLDDITVGYYNNTYIPIGNTTNEDDVIDPDYMKKITEYMYKSFGRRWALLSQGNNQNSLDVYQTMTVCELLDLDKPGQMRIRDAAGGSTTDELTYFNNTFTYNVFANITKEQIKPHLEDFKHDIENIFYQVCISTLKNYLKKRESQLNRKKKPKVRIFQKKMESGLVVSCLATGFYPRHINLSLLRDGQPVSDHEITGGDLLPNGDGTYQMRKSLEITGEERDRHNYTCSVTHLDNILNDTLDNNTPMLHIGVAIAVVLASVSVISAVLIWKKKQAQKTREHDPSVLLSLSEGAIQQRSMDSINNVF